MKAYSLIVIFICCICKYTSIDIMLNSKETFYILDTEYEGMFSHSFDRFYVVTKFILPTIEDVKFSSIDY